MKEKNIINMESRWMKILSICSVEIFNAHEYRYHFATDAVRKIESRSMSFSYRRTLLHSGEPCCFSMASSNPSEEREREYSPAGLLVSDIHNTRHPPRHSMLSPREILFSFRKYKAHRPRPLLSCIDFISSPDSRLLSPPF